jgi:ABC-type proline/glycine betaine transport system substrate-binding protein
VLDDLCDWVGPLGYKQAQTPNMDRLASSGVTFTNAQMGEVLAWRLDNNASNEEAAVYFLSTYQDVWADWLDDEAKENQSALLK